MKARQLGSLGLAVGEIGLGCMGMSDFYGVRDDETSLLALKCALDMGVSLLDTADSYASGENESFIGRHIRGARDTVIVATKFGHIRDGQGIYHGVSGRPEYVKAACHASLQRLGVETIDLYFQHRVDPLTPIEETVGAMSDLVKEGKVRFIGLSEAGASIIRRAHAIHPVAAVQSEYSLWSRDVETDILPTCRELGIGFVAYSPLGRGFLTGQIKRIADLPESDYRRETPRFEAEHFEHNLKLVTEVERIAGEKACTPAQLALAWVLSRGSDIVPIPGTKKPQYVRQNIEAAAISLTPADIAALDRAFPHGAASGARYNEWGMGLIGGERGA